MGERLGQELVPDGLWEIVEPLLPPQRERPQGGGTRFVEDRAVFTAVVYGLTTRARAKSSDSPVDLCGCWRKEGAIRCRTWAVASTDRPPDLPDLGRSRVLTMQVERTAVAQEA